MLWLLVLALLVPNCLAVDTEDAGMWDAFEQLKPEMTRLGMSEQDAMDRIDIFRRNYNELVDLKAETGSDRLGINLMAFLDIEEKNTMIDNNNKINQARSKRAATSAIKKFVKAGPHDLDFLGLDFVDNLNNNDTVPVHYDTAKDKIAKTAEGFPDAHRDWKSGAGWAFAAAWTMDLLNALYDKNFEERMYTEFGCTNATDEVHSELRKTIDKHYREELNTRPREWKSISDRDLPHWVGTTLQYDPRFFKEKRVIWWYTRGGNLTLEQAKVENKTLSKMKWGLGRNQEKRKFLHWFPEWLRHSVSRSQLFNCVYRDNGFSSDGEPSDAFQWMSDNVLVKSMRQKPHGLSSGSMAIQERREMRFDRIVKWQERSSFDPDCSRTAMEPEDMEVMKFVTFMPGKAYVKFADNQPSVVTERKYVNKTDSTQECPENWNTTRKNCRDLAKNGSDWVAVDFDKSVMGEKLIKPLVFRKGAVLIKMPTCSKMWSWSTGRPFDEDCRTQGAPVKGVTAFNDMWAVIIGYSKGYFTIGSLPFEWIYNTKHTMRISRLEKHKYVAHWDQLILPRVKKYDNCASLGGCGIGGRCTPDNTCYCPKDKVGANCETYLNCSTLCKNGGYCRGVAQCVCPKGFYGQFCEITCNCGMFGVCDSAGVCSCPRQVSYGANCQHSCDCGGKYGYCHSDGKCDCLAGKSSLDGNGQKSAVKCSEKCSKKCSLPQVCRYSKGAEYCDCTFGFYGDNCDEKVNCDRPEEEDTARCSELVDRERCNSYDAKKNCPNRCGHCLWLKQGDGQKDFK